jgi:hypothetical protein
VAECGGLPNVPNISGNQALARVESEPRTPPARIDPLPENTNVTFVTCGMVEQG